MAYTYLCQHFPIQTSPRNPARDWLHAGLVYNPVGDIETDLGVLILAGFKDYGREWEYYKRVVGHDRTTHWTSLFAPLSDWSTYERDHSAEQITEVVRALPLLHSLRTIVWIYTETMKAALKTIDTLVDLRVRLYGELLSSRQTLHRLQLTVRAFFDVDQEGKVSTRREYTDAFYAVMARLYYTYIEADPSRAKKAEARKKTEEEEGVEMEDLAVVDEALATAEALEIREVRVWGLLYYDQQPESHEGKETKQETKTCSDLQTVGRLIASVLPKEWQGFQNIVSRLHFRKTEALSGIKALSSRRTFAEGDLKQFSAHMDHLSLCLWNMFSEATEIIGKRVASVARRQTVFVEASHKAWECLSGDETVNNAFNRTGSELAEGLNDELHKQQQETMHRINGRAFKLDTGYESFLERGHCEKTGCYLASLLSLRGLTGLLSSL